ncbi:protein piccolo [Caerostris extrusa]|uniref:Protein piccolo n=1 Tax=Caerostris extrusa TaxID=172846 RepID=A0AAV4VGV1_CAEEX|nr:protein piccolo [Caerostris extrusa]
MTNGHVMTFPSYRPGLGTERFQYLSRNTCCQCREPKRRTRYFRGAASPSGKQTMKIRARASEQLKKKHLEISVWNYDINRPRSSWGGGHRPQKDSSVIDEQSRWYKLHPHDPKKYPCQSASTLGNEGSIKMARLNNPSAQKSSLYFEGADDSSGR